MDTTEIKSGRVLIDFYATWCAPCKMLSKNIELYESQVDEVKVVKVNIEEEQEMSMAFGVRSVPTLVYMVDGSVVERVVGVKSVEQLKELTKVE